MPSLADFQAGVRRAVLDGDATKIAPLLIGGRDPARRLAIHQRHYEASLVRALSEKYPATVWLVGSEFVSEAARVFVHRHPPSAPCIAEYGAGFPEFLAGRPGAERVPWVRWVGELEWHLGHVALAIERVPFNAGTIAGIDAGRLPDCALHVQPGLRYLAAPWPVDELVKLYLAEVAPERYEFNAESIWLELSGARGSFAMTRLDAATFAFRTMLAAGSTIGHAAERAMEANSNFDPGQALAALFAGGSVTTIVQRDQGSNAMSATGQHDTASIAGLRRLFTAARSWLELFPLSILQLGMRIGVGAVFFNSGLLKYNSFEFAVKLFEDEYKVPLLDPTMAARLAMLNELTFPVLLFLGLATRLATLPLLGMVFVIQVFVYPQAWTDHLMWASMLVFLLTRGPGVLSLDHLVERRFCL